MNCPPPIRMFSIKFIHTKRVSFATKLFPRINSSLNIETSQPKPGDDGKETGLFHGGRSRNKDLLTLFGFIPDSQRGASTFVQLPLFRRSVKKLIRLVEQELDSLGAHEVLLPTLIPQKLWRQSKRLERNPDSLNHVYKFKDSANNELLLGPTFEESITQLVADLDPLKEHELPLLLYQTSPKFRYEPNPRFGLIRSNEFLMNDLYSFDIDVENSKKTYQIMTEAYERIFDSLKLPCIRVESDPGNIGGLYSHEFQLPVSSGEDVIMKCNSCSYLFNKEMYRGAEQENVKPHTCIRCESSNLNEFNTLELAHTFLLSDIYSEPFKARTKSNGTRVNYEMGCFGLGLTRILGAGLDFYSTTPQRSNLDGVQNSIAMRWPSRVEPFTLGIVSPARRSKQFNGGSTEFIENLTSNVLDSTRDIDIIIEDRDKDGIFKRLAKLQSLGIPNIIVVGQRFLIETPEVELLTLNDCKTTYEQHWMTGDQVIDFLSRLEV